MAISKFRDIVIKRQSTRKIIQEYKSLAKQAKDNDLYPEYHDYMQHIEHLKRMENNGIYNKTKENKGFSDTKAH